MIDETYYDLFGTTKRPVIKVIGTGITQSKDLSEPREDDL